jgi:hypothetical protein
VTGWSVGAGNIEDWTQAPLALVLYTAFTGQSYRDGPANDVILTDHALGERRAGLVSALSGSGFDVFGSRQGAFGARACCLAK